MPPAPGSFRVLVRDMLRIYGLRHVVWLPLAVAATVTVVSAVFAPGNLDDEVRHARWTEFFSTAAHVDGTLLIALAIEARAPFTRAGGAAVRIAAIGTALLLASAAGAALLALSPSLSAGLYSVLFVITWAGLSGGLTGVVLTGITAAVGALQRLERAELEKLRDLGDPSAESQL